MNTIKLQEHSYITENVLKTLKQNRITTVIEFLQEDPEKISNLTKLKLPQVLEIRKEFFNRHSAKLISGTSLLIKSLTCRNSIATGIDSLDTILNGGIPIGSITEVCGLAGCGKSQLCMQLAINTVKNSEDTVLYIDTKGDFSAVRIQKILDTHGYSHKDMAIIMLKIKIIRIWNLCDLITLFENMKEGHIKIDNLALTIVDSLPCLMFQHFGDDNKLGLTFLNRVVNCSRYISRELNIGFVFVNIQTRWIDHDIPDPEDIESATTMKDYIEKRSRCLGKYWKTIPALLIMIERNNELSLKSQESYHYGINVVVEKCTNPYVIQKCFLNISDKGVS